MSKEMCQIFSILHDFMKSGYMIFFRYPMKLQHSNSLELIAHCEAMHTGCYLNESIDFSSIASLHISSSERYWLNRSLIVWHASGGCLKV